DARQKANANLFKLRSDRQRVQQLRFETEHVLNIPIAPAFRVPPDQRLGLHTSVVPPVLAAQLNLEKNTGLVIDRVDPRSPADMAGFKVNDLLVKVGDKPAPGDSMSFRRLLADIDPDKPFDVVLLRVGKEETIKGVKIPKETVKEGRP